jgi:hypothetical protein
VSRLFYRNTPTNKEIKPHSCTTKQKYFLPARLGQEDADDLAAACRASGLLPAPPQLATQQAELSPPLPLPLLSLGDQSLTRNSSVGAHVSLAMVHAPCLHGARQSWAPGALRGTARCVFSLAVPCLPSCHGQDWIQAELGVWEPSTVDRGFFSPMRCVVEAMCNAGGIFAVIAIDKVGARRS